MLFDNFHIKALVKTITLVGIVHFTKVSYFCQMGTRFYTAPEILFDGPYSTPADLWSVGCIFGEMIIGNPIFETLYACQNELEAIFRY